MRRASPLVFINYRGGDEPWAAVALKNELSYRFGDGAVFLDSMSITPGDDFHGALLGAVDRSSVILVVIGHEWVNAEKDGRRLLDDDRDWVRVEIAKGLADGSRVIPVLVGDASPPRADELPDNVRELARCQYLRLRHRDARQDLAQVTDVLLELEPRLGLAP